MPLSHAICCRPCLPETLPDSGGALPPGARAVAVVSIGCHGSSGEGSAALRCEAAGNSFVSGTTYMLARSHGQNSSAFIRNRAILSVILPLLVINVSLRGLAHYAARRRQWPQLRGRMSASRVQAGPGCRVSSSSACPAVRYSCHHRCCGFHSLENNNFLTVLHLAGVWS